MTRAFIIGGARSGKSTYAENLAGAFAKEGAKEVIYIATAQSSDSEMAQRIRHHRQQRDTSWTMVEAPLALAAAIAQHSKPDTVVLVDCLTVWLANLLFSEQKDFPDIGIIIPPACFQLERAALMQALDEAQGDVILVSNEVGQGIVPQGAISRWFVDEAGRLNQAVAARCDRAVLIVAGLPLTLKG